MGKGARTKGYIKNMKTGEIRQFMYNPTSFGTERSVEFNEMSAPGSSYPKFQYVSGQVRGIELMLFLHGEGSKVVTNIDFLNNLLPEENSSGRFNKPPVVLFAFGSFIKKCIVESVSVSYEEFHADLKPRIAVVGLSLKVVA